MELPTQRISLEMRCVGSIISPLHRIGAIISRKVEYFCDPKNKDLGIVKAQRKDKRNQELDLSPFPDKTFFPSS